MLTLSTMEDSGSSSNLTAQLILIVVLIIINAILAASELAILSSNDYKINSLIEKNNKKAKLVKKLKENETSFLSTIQVGITLAGFFSSASASVSLSDDLAKIFMNLNIPFSETLAIIIVTLILSYFTLVLGELLPKRLALRNPEGIAMFVAGPVNVLRIIFKPIVWFLSGSCELICKLFKMNNNIEEKVSEEEIKALVSSSVEDGIVTKAEQDLINSVLIFGELIVNEVMTPRVNICMIDIDENIDNIKKIIKNEKFTRFPVYKNTKDNIIGILNIKDLIINFENDYSTKQLLSILREPLFVSESMKADILMKKMQIMKTQCALVVDENGSISGYVTMEDLIEEVMGNIDDEYDDTIEVLTKITEDIYHIDGSITLRDLNKELEINIIKENNSFSTIAGFITYKLESLPKRGDEIYLANYNINFKVIEVVNNRIKTIELIKNYKKENNNNEDN